MEISRRTALKGGAAVGTFAVPLTATAVRANEDIELLELAREHSRFVELDDRLYATITARMPKHLQNVRSREATRAFLNAGLQPDLIAIQNRIFDEKGPVRLRQEMAGIQAMNLQGIHAKLQAAWQCPGPGWATPRLVRTAAEDLERFIEEGGS